ncbi:beta-defensin 113 [Trichechus manatus latirostris]|uniref:Beta-defensin n=1 Tax=Trichechus manatus latirostris TaxID=127582 RepID=A0A2Y9S231_TRIMA|nr:beta-defensin 113 [Trichechus manatus latirostris]
MKIICIFLTFLITVSCGPSVSEKKRREIAERKRECYLVRGVCKTKCNTWEYIHNYCNVEPCCVLRDYQKPVMTTAAYTDKNFTDFTI